MGKKLIIRDADFSENAINQIINQKWFIPQAVTNSIAKSFFTVTNNSGGKTWTLRDDVNELYGKTISGFDLLFENKCNGQAMGIDITFNPNTEQKIVCNIVCNFETQNESEEKIIHYKLPKPYTFKENDVIQLKVTNATYHDREHIRGGCAVFRAERPNNIPNFAFLIDSIPSYSYQPFMKLYRL